MVQAFMAYPELRTPFEAKDIHPQGSATVLYQGKTITLAETGDGEGLLIAPKDLESTKMEARIIRTDSLRRQGS